MGSNAQILPARRIVESISTLGRMLHDASGKQVQLFFTGHSLGAGVASLAYCRALQGLDDPHLVLRDAYLFGCLSVGDANFLSGFEKLMHANANTCVFSFFLSDLFSLHQLADVHRLTGRGVSFESKMVLISSLPFLPD